ncbi:lipopolysaccharides biosynthesis acetyltransferase [Synechococcus sp. WH 8103]|nr:lipopolysaccharides biosynthesis acetyltransferase [Synechococcus sp. WH 8103]
MKSPSIFVHESAIIDKGAKIGVGTRIWHWTHVCGEATIGENCSLGQNVYVANQVKIGNNVKIQNNVSIYDKVVLESDVFCGPSVVFTNVINPRSAIPRKDEFQETHVECGATLGANCTIVCGRRIGKYSFVAAGAVVTSDVKPFALMMGVPARQVGWWSAWGKRIPLPLEGSGVWTCPHTGDTYNLVASKLFSTKSHSRSQ